LEFKNAGKRVNFWERLVVAVLATWRVTHLLTSEDGPADLIVRFRVLLGQSMAGKLLDCFNCFSFWVAAAAALFVSVRPLDWLFSWLALSGGACLLNQMTREPVLIEPLLRQTEGDLNYVLRTEAIGTTEQPGANVGTGDLEIHIQR
jgi:hypothetical protein